MLRNDYGLLLDECAYWESLVTEVKQAHQKMRMEFENQMAQDNDVWRIELKGHNPDMARVEAFLRGRRAGMEQMLALFER